MIRTLLQSTIGDQELSFIQAPYRRAKLMASFGRAIRNLSLVEMITSSFGIKQKGGRDNSNPKQSPRSAAPFPIIST
jgi:hypothetical protein